MVDLDCSGKLGKFILVIINCVFMLLGISIMVPGILVQLDSSFINDNVLPLLNQLSFAGVSLGNASRGLSITLISIGASILIISCLGAFGAWCHSRMLLIVYAAIVLVLLLTQVVMAVLWIVMKAEIENKVKAELLSQLHNNYQADDLTTHELSTAWNYMFMQLSCCGIDAVTGTTNDFDNTVWQGTSPSEDIPKGCCGATVSTYATFSDTSCTNTVTSGFYSVGCYDAMKNVLSTYSDIFIGVGICVILTETLAVICACCICKQLGKRVQSIA